MNELTQISDVLAHLQEHGSITSLQAISIFGASRLSAIIYLLRDRGYLIDTVMEKGKTRYNRSTRWARYVYKGKVAK